MFKKFIIAVMVAVFTMASTPDAMCQSKSGKKPKITNVNNKGNAQTGRELYYLGKKAYDFCNFPEAIRLFKMSAAKDYGRASYYLGEIYSNGYGVDCDYDEAAKWREKAKIDLLRDAENGDPYAQDKLGYIYDSKWYEKSFPQFEKLAKQGVAEAQYYLGMAYGWGKGTENDGDQCVYWMYKAADQGYAPAMYYLSRFYLFGDGVERDVNKAIEMGKKAYNGGYKLAITYIWEGYELLEDNKNVIFWLEKDLKETGYDLQGYYFLGELYEKEGDLTNAIRCYTIAADNGSQDAVKKINSLR